MQNWITSPHQPTQSYIYTALSLKVKYFPILFFLTTGRFNPLPPPPTKKSDIFEHIDDVNKDVIK